MTGQGARSGLAVKYGGVFGERRRGGGKLKGAKIPLAHRSVLFT